MSELREKWTDEKIKELLENLYTLQEFGSKGLELKLEGDKQCQNLERK